MVLDGELEALTWSDLKNEIQLSAVRKDSKSVIVIYGIIKNGPKKVQNVIHTQAPLLTFEL